ncbi:MAG: hypothetical protein WC916_00020 [Candidatus Woesearchaeota archaeon]
MDSCKDCIRTVRTEHGEMSVDMCKMLGICTCNHIHAGKVTA